MDRAGVDGPPGALVEVDHVSGEMLPTWGPDQHSRWSALVVDPAWPGGTLPACDGDSLRFEVVARREGLARLVLDGGPCDAQAVCAALARADMPVAGDLERGGLAVAGGPRLVPGSARDGTASETADLLGWPEEPVWQVGVGRDDGWNDTAEPPAARAGATGALTAPRLVVSHETARAIGRGHAWILPDEASDSPQRFRPGTLLRVEDRAQQLIGWARAEGDARPAARIWAAGAIEPTAIPSVEARIARALARRRSLLVDVEMGGTNAFRLIHGEADGLPGLFIDRLGPLLRVLVTGRSTEGFRDRALSALHSQLPLTPEGEPWSVLELLHLRAPSEASFDRVRWLAGGPDALAASGLEIDETGFRVFERGLSFAVDPGWDSPCRTRPGFGLFLDQRDNRGRLAIRATRGGRWLNLFAHTGAFSVALLAAGAEQVVSVDLSAPYLHRLQANLEANRERGVEPDRHQSIRSDGRRYLERLAGGLNFDGIVVDPPTAAAAGRRFWSLRRDLEPLLQRCIERLAPGGVLLATQNRSGPPLGLDRALARIAGRADRLVVGLQAAPAGLDHPVLPGFPEGEPFEGYLMELE